MRAQLPRFCLPFSLAALALAGCTYEKSGPVLDHYQQFSVEAPNARNRVNVCHGYGCRTQSKFTFTAADVAELRTLMKKTKKADTPVEERRAVAYAVGWIERRVGKAIGTDADRAGMDFGATGDPTQQDCVDEATNTTSYLLMLAQNGLIKHHAVGTPFAKEDFSRGVAGWTHWTAVLKENKGGQKFAVDSWIYANGENPAIVETEKWYIADLATLPASTR